MKSHLLVLTLLLCTAVCVAQTTLPDAPSAPPPTRHILGIIPDYDVLNLSKDIPPLSSREKFRLFTTSTFDRFTPISAAFDAAINQATNTPEGYGQGGEAYAKRYGVAVADKVASNFFKQYMFPSIFREDPRYFRLGPAAGRNRFGYALSRVVVTRMDSGRSRFNFSEVFGNFAAAGLVNAYYEERDRDATTTVERGLARIGLDAAVNIFKEFWPDVRGSMRRQRNQPNP